MYSNVTNFLPFFNVFRLPVLIKLCIFILVIQQRGKQWLIRFSPKVTNPGLNTIRRRIQSPQRRRSSILPLLYWHMLSMLTLIPPLFSNEVYHYGKEETQIPQAEGHG